LLAAVTEPRLPGCSVGWLVGWCAGKWLRR